MGDVAAVEDLLSPSAQDEVEESSEHAGPLSTSTDHDLSVRVTPSDNTNISSGEEDLEHEVELTKVNKEYEMMHNYKASMLDAFRTSWSQLTSILTRRCLKMLRVFRASTVSVIKRNTSLC